MDQHHWSYDNSGHPPPYNDGGHFNHGGGFSNDGHYNHHHNNHRRYQNHHHDEPTDSFRFTNGPAFSGRKRQYSHEIEGGSCVKLYVNNCPTEVTEQDIRSVFGEYGNISEVILFKQIIHLQQQGKTDCCFVKYTNIEDAEQAIRALHGQYTFPGKPRPIEVRYASKKQERPGPGPGPGVIGGFKIQENKVFVGSLNKHATKPEIADIFSPYGYVEDIYIIVDDMKRSRGMGFITFSDKAMAVAAINGLNGQYIMEGCDQPLVVRFAAPKKPKFGESRFGDPAAQTSLPNTSYMSSHNGSEHPSVSSSSSAPAYMDTEDLPECDWSEHICPDGNTYYYNCVTSESLWKKPEEYSFFEQYLENYNQYSPWQQTY
ncbi:flowering time control protein FCA [Rutidosis leptorrhynchoides]|uniref:flowering time control protein FCA n=1 Tax=Rutidosis leptorrhynchoides TaxID=125765 RepID=UPI003A99AD30